MFCTNCGNGLVANAKFCTRCGGAVNTSNIAGFQGPSSHQPHGAVPAKRKTPYFIAIVISAVVVVLAAVGLLYFMDFPASPGTPHVADWGSRDDERDVAGRTMSVLRITGDTVTISRPRADATDARVGMGLRIGYSLVTGHDSFCYISLDRDSIVKMDVFTDISVVYTTARLLRLNINSGQVLLDVNNQEPEHVLEALVGNTAMSVRGTLFIAGVYANGEAMTIVLYGSIYVNGIVLDSGYTMIVYDGYHMSYSIAPTDFTRIDRFALTAFYVNGERLVNAGALTVEEFEFIRWLYYGIEYEPFSPEVEEAAIEARPILMEIARLCAAGDVMAAFAAMQTEDFRYVAQLARLLDRPYIAWTPYGRIGVYEVDSWRFGNFMLYFGGFDGDIRSGHGYWLGSHGGSNYFASGHWENDMPNGFFTILEWSTLDGVGFSYREISGNAPQGFWNGDVLWSSQRADGSLIFQNVRFDMGRWIAIDTEVRYGERIYTVYRGNGRIEVWGDGIETTRGIVGFADEEFNASFFE